MEYKLSDLAIDHPYYCSESNYYSNEATYRVEQMSDFLDEMENADVDLNLVFRWDIKPNRDYETDEIIDGYYAEIFIIKQRKGIFMPCLISDVKESDVPRLVDYLQKHHAHFASLWAPLPLPPTGDE